MPERPLLLLPSPGVPLARPRRFGGGGDFPRPTREDQAERLSPRFVALQEALDKRRAELRMEASDLVPEEVVVLETVGTVDDLIRAVGNVPGMEFLAEVEADAIPPDHAYSTTLAEQSYEAISPRLIRNACARFDSTHPVIMLYFKYGRRAHGCAVAPIRVLISPRPMLNDSSLKHIGVAGVTCRGSALSVTD